jgi:hypothetical protein
MGAATGRLAILALILLGLAVGCRETPPPDQPAGVARDPGAGESPMAPAAGIATPGRSPTPQIAVAPAIAGPAAGLAGDSPAATPLFRFLEPFDGQPTGPQPWRPAGWDITIHSRDRDYWSSLESMSAHHGPHCEGPPAEHAVGEYADSVFLCNDHVMTALFASDYGVIYLTPDRLVDFSAGEAVVRFDLSTLRTSTRDWIDLWLTPYEDNLQLPLEDWLPDLNGEPRRAVHIRMEFGDRSAVNGSFGGEAVRDFVAEELPERAWAGYETFLEPSATQRETFELRLSADHIAFGMPDYDYWWIDTAIEPLEWRQAIVQFGHHSYNPLKNCPTCAPNTWHWDNVTIEPAVPFTIIPGEPRAVDEVNDEVTFPAAAPENAHLRFAGIGEELEVSFDGGRSWQPATLQSQESFAEEHFRSYWMPVPAGIGAVHFRGRSWWGGPWHVRDISIWAPPLSP